MTAAKLDSFCQIPLRLLAAGSGVGERTDMILAYIIMTSGRRKLASVEKDTDEMSHWIPDKADVDDPKYDHDNPDHRAWALGTATSGIGYYFKTFEACMAHFNRAEQFLKGLRKSPMVRIAPDVIKDVISGALPYPKFACVMAVYATIGSKKYAICRRHGILAGMLGYSSARELFDKGGNITPEGRRTLRQRADGRTPESIHALRYLLDVLEDRHRFFVRFSPEVKTRTMYFGRGCSHEELAVMLANKKNKKSVSKIAKDAARAVYDSKVIPSHIKEATHIKEAKKCEIPNNNGQITQSNGANARGPKVTSESPQDSPQESPQVRLYNICSTNKCLPHKCLCNNFQNHSPSGFIFSDSGQQGESTAEEKSDSPNLSAATDQKLLIDRIKEKLDDEISMDENFPSLYAGPNSESAVVDIAEPFGAHALNFGAKWYREHSKDREWLDQSWKIAFLTALWVEATQAKIRTLANGSSAGVEIVNASATSKAEEEELNAHNERVMLEELTMDARLEEMQQKVVTAGLICEIGDPTDEFFTPPQQSEVSQ